MLTAKSMHEPKSYHFSVCACGYTKEEERNKEEIRAISATQLEIVKNGLPACVCLHAQRIFWVSHESGCLKSIVPFSYAEMYAWWTVV